MTDTTQAADAAPSADHTNLMIDPTPPPVEKPETFTSDRHGIASAADALTEERKAREAEVERPIKKWKLDDDAPKSFRDAKEAAPWLSANRKTQRALERNLRNPGEDAWVSGNVVRQEAEVEHAPIEIKYIDGRPANQPHTLREAAKVTAAARETIPAALIEREEQFKAEAERRRWATELGVDDLIQQAEPQAEQGTHEAEQPRPEPAQPEAPDPVEQRRQAVEREFHIASQLRNATGNELLLDAQIRNHVELHNRVFPDVRSMADVQKLSPEWRQAWLQSQERLQHAAAEMKQHAMQRELAEHKIAEARRVEQDQAFAAYRAEQTAVVEKSIPELAPGADPAEQYAFQKSAQALLEKHLGITLQNARSLPPEIQRALHHAGFAEIIAMAVRYQRAQDKAKTVQAKPLPQVQRPGVAQPKGSARAADVSYLSEKIDRARPGSDKQLRAAAALIATRRANKGR